jgi:tetratricopeptide (TPR) repeat protein
MGPERRETAKRLFERASELSAEARAAFLDETCADDPELRSELSSLLRAAGEAEPFFRELAEAVIPLPPVPDEPTWSVTSDAEYLVDRTVHQYRIEEKLGRGGMGVVYRAHDTRLDRTVALKFLPRQVVADEDASERFVVEARAAAALDHANVCNVHEISRDEEGRPFIAMAFYDGETLKLKLARGALPVEEAADYAAQIAAGLAAAHAHGIVHRDVKPGNVIVTSEGVVKILDFGLAKLADVTLTGTGVTLGTAAYMSPEQTRGDELDARTDLWSLGVVLYEMLTGHRPFQGDRQGAVIHAIRHDDPEPPRQLREEVSREVQELVLGLLSKDPEAREWPAERLGEEPVPGVGIGMRSMMGRFRGSTWLPLSAMATAFLAASWVVLWVVRLLAEHLGLPSWVFLSAIILLLIGFPIVLATAAVQAGLRLKEPESGRAPSVSALPRSARYRIFTWRNALLGGGAALTLLGILALGWVITRTLGVGPAATLMAQGMLGEREPILLADFESTPADSLFATTLTELVRIDLGRSPVVRLVEPGQIRRTLERMERDPARRLDPALTHQVAVRDGIGAYITRGLNRLGPSFVLTAELTATEDEAPLWMGREIASDSAEIIGAVERLARSLRERVGESLRSLSQSAPLPRVTTSSLEALEKYALAKRLGAWEQRLTLLEDAIALDSTFAMAHATIGMDLWARGMSSAARRALESAMRLSDRLPDAERYVIGGLYYAVAEEDWDRAAAEWRTLVEIQPDHALGWRGLAIAYMNTGADLQKVHAANFKAAEADPYAHGHHLVESYILLGNLDAADSVINAHEQRHGVSWTRRAWLEANRGNWPAVRHLLRTALAHYEGPVGKAKGYRDLTMAHLVGGQLDSADVTGRKAMQNFAKAGQATAYLSMACELADLALLRGGRDGALAEVAAARVRFPLDSLEVIDWPASRLAYFYVNAAAMSEANHILQIARERPKGNPQRSPLTPLTPLGMVALAGGRPEEAVGLFREEVATWPICRLCGPARLGLAWDRAGVADSTITYYESYLATPDPGRLWFDAHYLANILERLGQLHDEQGDLEKAAEYHARFVELWKDSDPELQPRVQAAQQRLNEIFAERG